MNKRLKKGLISLGSILIFLLAAEAAVRRWAPQELISNIVASDKDLCHHPKANAVGVQNAPEFKIDLKINSLGVRDQPYSTEKREGIFRVLMLGDSHTFGWGVQLDEIFSKRIERRLNFNSAAPKFEVINCGMYGFGTAHQFQFLRKYGYELEPDLVVIAVDLLHDIRINNGGYFYFEGDEFVRSARPCFIKNSRALTAFIPFSSFLRGHSHFFRYAGVESRKLYVKVFSAKRLKKNKEVEMQIYMLNNTGDIFSYLKNELNKKGIKLAVVILPEFDSEKEKSKSTQYFEEVLASFENLLLSEGIVYLSLQDDFERHRNSFDFTFRYSHHFNKIGHQFIAEHVENFLHERNLLQ